MTGMTMSSPAGATGGAGVGDGDLDWESLREKATDAAQRAYVPYSHLRVGVAAVVDDGRILLGCNVENASYGLSLCAECTLVGQLRLSGGGRLVAVACRSGAGQLLMPCGRCRQLLYEFGGPGLVVDTPAGLRPMSWVLPAAFGPEHLPAP
jgi:cytidine deaminase